MDPLTASIVLVLGRYALDKGVELGKEVGPKALDTAAKLFRATLDYLRQQPAGKVIADKFEEKPQVYAEPIKDELEAAVQADPAFAAKLKELLAEYDRERSQYTAAPGISYRATVTGSGAIAQGTGSTAVGAGGVYVGGSAGNITTGSHSPIGAPESRPSAFPPASSPAAPPATAAPASPSLRQKLTENFNEADLRNLCQDLRIDYEGLAGEEKGSKARELVAYCERSGRLPDLLARCRQLRPSVDWG